MLNFLQFRTFAYRISYIVVIEMRLSRTDINKNINKKKTKEERGKRRKGECINGLSVSGVHQASGMLADA